MNIVHFADHIDPRVVHTIEQLTGLFQMERHFIVLRNPGDCTQFRMSGSWQPDPRFGSDTYLCLGVFYEAAFEMNLRPSIVLGYNIPDDVFLIEPTVEVIRLGAHGDHSLVLRDFPDPHSREYYLDPKQCNVVKNVGKNKPSSKHQIDLLVSHTNKNLEQNIEFIVDCMADGIPVIARRTKETQDIICHGVNGILYTDPAEADVYAEALREDPLSRMQLGQEASNWIRNYADLDSVVGRIEECR